MSLKYKKGELIALSEGSYSDYCVESLSRAMVDFDASKILHEWAKENAEREQSTFKSGEFNYKQKEGGMSFVEWLNKNGYTEDVEYRELHIGDYYYTKLTNYDDY